ncbi:MAG: hypothetical protein B7Y47_11935 [Sphingomonas sp. 28-63-12]|nr:MAG: hypothetical protein B7Y47_11935 [Sphingomonas sp. 28-63-12]
MRGLAAPHAPPPLAPPRVAGDGERGDRFVRTKLSICARKKRYKSAEAALAAARETGLTLFAYRCDRCQLFHLTSRSKGKWVSRG